MSKHALTDFKTRLAQDEGLREALTRAFDARGAEASADDVVAFAKTHGYEFSADELLELNDDELESVAGGLAGCATGEHIRKVVLT